MPEAQTGKLTSKELFFEKMYERFKLNGYNVKQLTEIEEKIDIVLENTEREVISIWFHNASFQKEFNDPTFNITTELLREAYLTACERIKQETNGKTEEVLK